MTPRTVKTARIGRVVPVSIRREVPSTELYSPSGIPSPRRILVQIQTSSSPRPTPLQYLPSRLTLRPVDPPTLVRTQKRTYTTPPLARPPSDPPPSPLANLLPQDPVGRLLAHGSPTRTACQPSTCSPRRSTPPLLARSRILQFLVARRSRTRWERSFQRWDPVRRAFRVTRRWSGTWTSSSVEEGREWESTSRRSAKVRIQARRRIRSSTRRYILGLRHRRRHRTPDKLRRWASIVSVEQLGSARRVSLLF